MEELRLESMLQDVMGFMGGMATSRGKPYSIGAYGEMSLDDLRTSESSGRGTRLVKFFPDEKSTDNRNYSEEALRSQTVFLADPKTFNDPFDCIIGYDQERTIHSLLSKLSAEFGVENLACEDLSGFEQMFAKRLTDLNASELPRLKKLEDGPSELWYHMAYYNILFDSTRRGLSAIDGDAVHAGLLSLFGGVGSITSNYGVSCFTDRAENGYMWAHYASGYRGFAIEYENDPSRLEASGFLDPLANILELNIWDVFYLLERPDCTDMVEQYITCSPDSEWLTELYVKGLCTKHISWGLENESRLILPVNNPVVISYKRNIPFYPARCVYLGVDMPEERRREIINICSNFSSPPKVFIMTTDTSTFLPCFEEVHW